MENHTSIKHLLPERPLDNVANPVSVDDLHVLHEVVEHEMNSEMGEYMSEHKDVVSIDPVVASVGVQSTGNPQFTTTAPIVLPLDDNSIMTGLKAPFSSSLRWLAEYCVYLLKRAHLHLKVMHGKLMRVSDKKSEKASTKPV